MSVKQKEQFLTALTENNNSQSAIFSKAEAIAIADAAGLKSPMWFFKECKVGRNQFSPNMAGVSYIKSVPPVVETSQSLAPIAPIAVVQTQPVEARIVKQAKLEVEIENLVPATDSTYVPFGFYRELTTIVKSGMFYPTFICGLSGNGKTMMVEQVCAKLKKEAIRVNISIETDEDDLIGGNTLVDGNVVYREGPVLTAMKRGAVLILDEIDRGSNKLMCLQAILEGKPYFNKKSGEVIEPASGFNVIATANTKGRGSDDGKFMGAQVLDEAFLERFAITVEQEYPSSVQEKKIVLNKMRVANCVDEDFADKLVMWADIIRKTFYEGGIDELVSTRRLEHITKAFAMFNDRLKAIQLCVNRFDTDTKTAFIDLYTKVDAGASVEDLMPSADSEVKSEEDSYDF
jgi:MoxR-like ATPase|tara:strand:+ start:686 stop:1894 length:1209 start_codon:yes stop_codon:yes gene_type:complete